MEYVTRILLNGLSRFLGYLFGGAYVSWINIKSIEDAANGVITLIVGILTAVFLCYQIKKTRIDIRRAKEGKTDIPIKERKRFSIFKRKKGGK